MQELWAHNRDLGVNMQEKINKFFNIIDNTKNFAYDVETSGLNWQTDYICGYSVSDGKDAAYVPVRHALNHAPETNIQNVELFESTLAKKVKEHKGKIIGHNIKFDAHFSENHGILLGNKQKDTMVRESIINENKYSYSLEATTKDYDIPQKKGKELYLHIASLIGCKPDKKSMAHFHKLRGDDPIAIEYAEYDTLSTSNLFTQQDKQIYAQELELPEDIESELTYVLQIMERQGVQVDLEEFERVKKRVDELRIIAYERIPLAEDFRVLNIRSNKDLREYFELCEIDNWEYTEPTERFPEGQPSFNKDWLSTSDAGAIILNARKYDHLISSFLDPFMSFVYNISGNPTIYTTFNQVIGEFGGTKSGRLSSVRPNMQQVPKRDEELGKIFRKVFKARKGYIFVEFDHSQAEPRLYAHYSQEPVLIEGYSKTPFIDMHSIAAEMMHIDRKTAKNLNLGILYTMGAAKLAKKLKITLDQAYAIISGWKRIFSHVNEFTNRASKVANSRIEVDGTGYVKTILGRRARFDDPRWTYRAANRIIQGSSADILKYKLVQIQRWIEKNNYQDVVIMLLNIHDAILFQIEENHQHLIPEIAKIFASVQEPPLNLRVPFHADYHIGVNWSEASYGTN